ncbi:MAG: PilZ domain-containing protein, partial [Planctomycetota bacterium]
MAKGKGKKRVTQEDIALACDIDQGSVSRILNKDTRDSFAAETVKQVFQIARELGYLHPALVTSNRRESERRRVGLRGNVSIIIGTNTVWDRGAVEIDELSQSGMLLRNFQTKRKTFPTDRFRCDVDITSPRLKGFRARCRVVRFSDSEDDFALAVRFDRLDETSKEKLRQFL